MEVRRFTKQRKLILDTVMNNQCHPTADTIYNLLKNDHPELSLGTVYRNLKVLSEEGHIQRISSSISTERFDGTVVPHHHMLCEKCNQIVDVVPDLTFNFSKDENGNQITNHSLIFYGICKKCLESDNN